MARAAAQSSEPESQYPSTTSQSGPSFEFHAISEPPRATVSPPPIPPKSNLRHSTSSFSLPRNIFKKPTRPSTSGATSSKTAHTTRTAPPAYQWIDESRLTENEFPDDGPVEGEKLAELRKAGGYKPPERGGWRRLGILIAVIGLVIVGLAVGLGVGLTVGRKGHGNDDNNTTAGPSNTTSGDSQAQPFPLGQFSMVTALKDVATDCTSNPTTWMCYPSVTYTESPSDSAAVFNWALSNTSSTYATVGTPSTPDEGVPANISISSNSGFLGFPFSDTPLTYISSASNTSSARYTFSLTMQKSVFPSASLTSDNAASECFFNQTTLTGTLYLTAARDFPSNSSGSGTSTTSPYMQWPYAVEISQTSNGGADTPACYEYVNGAVGTRITTGFTTQPADAQCRCGYRNF